jgi:hypothetical protein
MIENHQKNETVKKRKRNNNLNDGENDSDDDAPVSDEK